MNAKDFKDLQFVDHVLTNVARAYKPHGLAGPRLAPSIPVTLDAGKYPVFEGFFDDDVDNKVDDRAETPEVDVTWSEDAYLCETYRLKASSTEQEVRNAHSVIRLRQSKLDGVLIRMALRRERRIAAMLTHTSAGGQLTGGAHNAAVKWNAGATATIETDIKTGVMAVYNKTGMRPNTLVLDFTVAYEVALDPSIREIVKYDATGQAGNLLALGDRVLPAQMHGLNVVVIEGAMRNVAREGAARSLQGIWSDDVRLLYVAPGGGGWGIPSTAYTFKSKPEAVDRWVENDPPVEYVRASEACDEKVCAPDTGYVIGDVL